MPPTRSARSLIGKHAMPLSLVTSTGTPYRFKPGGRPIALFFFPQAGTIICIKETCSFRDAINSKEIWAKNDCEVIGISGNSVEENSKFVEDYRLPFTVLCDVDGAARKLYGTGKGMFGYDGRVTFFIDSMGIIRDIYDSFLNWNAHRKFVETWLERIEIERQPWSKFLDYPTIMEEYEPGALVGGVSPSLFGVQFAQIFPEAEEDSSSAFEEEGSIRSSHPSF